jgi:multiple sugar transport system ATP-binding protein
VPGAARPAQPLGATTVYVTHDQFEAMSMADVIAVMNHGVIEQLGPPQEVYDRPGSMFVADFIGSPPMNFLPLSSALAPGADQVRLGDVTVGIPPVREGLPESPLALGIRPEHVRIDDAAALRGEVYGTEYLGTTQIATIRTAHGQLKARLPSARRLSSGDRVGLTFKSEKLSVFEATSGRAVRTALFDAASKKAVRHG